jgi:hypothetical protein
VSIHNIKAGVMHKISLYLFFGIAMVVLSGCANKPPTTSDLMRGHASELQASADARNQSARDWDKGQKLILSGEKNIKKGEKRVTAAERNLNTGNDLIAQGKREIAEGNRLINESEQRFLEIFPDLKLNNDM